MKRDVIVKITTKNVVFGREAVFAFNSAMKEDFKLRSHEILNPGNLDYEIDFNTIKTNQGLFLVTFDYNAECVIRFEEVVKFDYLEV